MRYLCFYCKAVYLPGYVNLLVFVFGKGRWATFWHVLQPFDLKLHSLVMSDCRAQGAVTVRSNAAQAIMLIGSAQFLVKVPLLQFLDSRNHDVSNLSNIPVDMYMFCWQAIFVPMVHFALVSTY